MKPEIAAAAAAIAGTLAMTACTRQPDQQQQPASSAAPPAASQPAPAPAAGAPQWPQAASIDTAARSALPAEVRGRLQQSPVPVLIPRDPGIVSAAKSPTIGDKNYTFTSTTAGMTVSVQASVAVPPRSDRRMAPLARMRAGSRDIFLTENEGIRVATWKENGVAYAAEVECATTSDPRCRDDKYLLSIVENLAFVGGRGTPVP